ncbi:protein unc-13 homolog [Impatiens glandulifera]|uniref:protein unc-13 homolog n=1 Tax=Impatiens glandulifera TaxID=253017 RepID=UPI001FB144EC|nr:protein unc-13 homolog [Impatiens glandulifera]XP_047310109.1 protein unc-13 homolog [Impatiens glandulifera]
MGPDSTALSSPIDTSDDLADLIWPFGDLNGIDKEQLRETSYEIFFTACRSSPGFGAGVKVLNQAGQFEDGVVGPGSPSKGNQGVGMAVTSKVKRALGLKMLRRSQSRRTNSIGSPRSLGLSSGGGSSPAPGYSSVNSIVGSSGPARNRRPLTSAEIMRQQMKVTEHSDNRLRKTLMRTLVGQTGRRAETIILPLELLRQLKPSEFADSLEYHEWQIRQLKVLEAGLLLHPSIPFDKTNSLATRLREIVRSGEARPIDVGKNSEHIRSLCNCVVSLAWRSTDGSPTDVCHWADGYPFNVHTYIALLRCIFDIKEETVVIDEVDELLELMKKTWSILGMNRSIHNLCFMWVLFEQYVITGQVEPDLLSASLTMLNEVANDAKRPNREPLYVKMLGSVLSSIKRWSEKRLLDYHNHFHRGNVELMENMLPLVFAAMKILEEDILVVAAAAQDKGLEVPGEHSVESRIHQYIQSSMKNTSAQLIENRTSKTGETVELSDALLHLAKDMQELAAKEKEIFSPVLKKWYPVAGVAAMASLHSCYGTLLKQYLAGVTCLSGDMITVLQRAGKLEKFMIDMAIEESSGCGYEDPGKAIAKEMVPYEVDSVIMTLFKQWVDERLKKSRSCVERAKETETWNPKSKTEPYAQSATELMTLVKDDINDLFEIPLGVSENLVHKFANDFDQIFCDYISFVASCGSKQSYMPTLPPLTRCSRESNFYKIWKKISRVTTPQCDNREAAKEAHHPRPSTSRGTQRLYIRLNTLHYLLSQIHSFDKALSLSPRIIQSSFSALSTQKTSSQKRRHGSSFSSAVYFESTCSAIQSALEHVCQVAAYRLIFLDSNSVFYDCLYKGDVASNRIKPALRRLKQNLSLLGAIVTDRAQPMALREVMKASFEAFLMVLLAGGSMRAFYKGDHDMLEEDLDSLKRVFATCGEGLISEDVVEWEAKTVEGVVGLMEQPTEQLVEDFSQMTCDASGMGVAVVVGSGLGGGGSGSRRLPMPPTTGVWSRTDPNTILRVLCHRNDKAAGYFLKRTFQLPKR